MQARRLPMDKTHIKEHITLFTFAVRVELKKLQSIEHFCRM